MSIGPAPDVAGFLAAGKRLRQNLGSTVTLHVPVAPQWPAGTKINPDTGKPYDAMVRRTNAEFTDVEITGLIIAKQGSPMRPQADTAWEQVGLLSGMDIIIDVDADDYAAAGEATQFTVDGLDYTVEEWKPFELADQRYRWLLYGKEK